MIELRVNESALLQRVETRVAEMRARGEEVRVDDTPEVLTKRLASYRALTEPLIHYYSERRKLLTVDGMMTIEYVTREIDRILAAIGAVEAKAAKNARKAGRPGGPPRPAKRPPNRPPGRPPDRPARRSARKAAKAAGKGAKAAKTASKGAKKGAKRPARKAATGSRARATGEGPEKPPKRSRKSELKHRDG